MRVLALVLPDLACELAALARESAVGVHGALSLPPALAVVLAGSADEVSPTSPLFAINAAARRAGVRPGQSVAAARARAAALDVRRVSAAELERALGRVAELALSFGQTVELRAPDTVLVDVTGAGHLRGTEALLLDELAELVRGLGHRVRGAIAGGAELARAVASSGVAPRAVVPPGRERQAWRPLPVGALGLDDDARAFCWKVGVLSVDDLARQPRETLSARLGAHAARALALLDGDDRAPLVAFEPPRRLEEQLGWDEPVVGVEPLSFAARGLLARLSARLAARAEATSRLLVTVGLDAAMARLAGVAPELSLTIELPLALSREADLVRAVRAKLEGAALPAPAVRLSIVAPELTRAPRVQLDLSRDVTAAPEALSVLLAELTAELGADRVGVLSPRFEHLPELRSALVPLAPAAAPLPPSGRRRGDPAAQLVLWPQAPSRAPTRLLPTPAPIDGALAPGRVVAIGRAAYTVGEIVAVERLSDVGWWAPRAASRDLGRVWLSGDRGGAEAWVTRERRRLLVHGWSA
ncbi:MAG: DNA polymerase Y family protein [Polyangiaceae bacterium]|nr:DNA polymerase Y family protein [Polyangiaceae bacterium]